MDVALDRHGFEPPPFCSPILYIAFVLQEGNQQSFSALRGHTIPPIKKWSLTDIENRLVSAKGEGVMEWEASRYKLLHLEWISNVVLLYNTGNYT